MDQLKPPSELVFDGDLATSWKKWKQHFNYFMIATESDGKEDKVKTSILLSCIGSKGREVYGTFDFATPDDANNLDTVIAKFEQYCKPKKNITISRHKFFTQKQQDGQPFTDFVTTLKRLGDECEFQTLKESLVKDMIICGVTDNKLRERMLREADLDLPKAIKLGLAAEETQKHVKDLESSTRVITVNKINRAENTQKEIVNNCKYCSYDHPRGKCPAYGKTCKACNKRNHFSRCCMSKKAAAVVKRNSRTDESPSDRSSAQLNTSDSSSEEFYIDTIQAHVVNEVNQPCEVTADTVEVNIINNDLVNGQDNDANLITR